MLNLQTYEWRTWGHFEVPQVDDFAHCFDADTGTLWLFGGYYNGGKSNVFIRINVERMQGSTTLVEITTPDTPANHRNADNVPP